MAKPHIDRKELKGPDEFVESAGRFARYVDENRSTVIAVIAAAVVLFIGGVSYTAYRARTFESTAAAFLRAADAYQSDNLESAVAALSNVVDRNRAPYDDLARLYLADIEIKKGAYDAALTRYEELASSSSRPLVRQIALIGKGHALSVSGSHATAAQAYAAAADIDGPHRQTALRGRIKAALDGGDTAAAREAIEAILEEFPSVADAAELRAQLEKLQG